MKKSLIITVAGLSSRFNRDTETPVLKCLYHKETPHYSLLYQQIYKVYDAVDEIIIVGGYKFDDLLEFIKNELNPFKSKIKEIYNDHYLDFGSGYSLLKGLEAVSDSADEVLFIEGDLFFDRESVRCLINSAKDVITINNEPIRADKAVAVYVDTSHFLHYIFDTQHSYLEIDKPFLAIYNSGQMWKFKDLSRVRVICDQLTQEQKQGTNLEIIQKYFGCIDYDYLEIVQVKNWRNCNTVDDYLDVYNNLM